MTDTGTTSEANGAAPAPAKRPKGRSPSYPAITLETAIGRAKELYDLERQHWTAVATIIRHWGYTSLNGPASLTLAALKKFGLVEDEGTGAGRTARITELAVNILGNPDPEKRLSAIRTAALNPAIHRELWDEYHATNLPSSESLHWKLTQDRGFTETGANEFIPEFEQTIAFAQLSFGGTVQTQVEVPDEEKVGDQANDEQTESEKVGRRQRRSGRQRVSTQGVTYAVPVAMGEDVTIEGRFPLTEQEWGQFMAVLTAMKPALVGEKTKPELEVEADE